MSWDNIHVDDYGWDGKIRIVQDGVAVDISSYTTRSYTFIAPGAVQVEVVKTAVFDTTGVNGVLKYTAEQGFYSIVGNWTVRAKLSKTGAELTSKTLRFVVKPRNEYA